MQAAAPNAQLIEATQESIPERILDADIFVGHAKVPVPWDDVVRQVATQVYSILAAGLDHCLLRR